MYQQPEITIIAAVDNNGGIGNKGGLLCHLPADLKHFKELTKGHSIIMGRKTFESLPKGPLPYRRNIVVSRNLKSAEGYETAESLEAALNLTRQEDKVFVIGGGMLYKEAMQYADCLEITHINAGFEADTFFPVINTAEWEKTAADFFEADEKNAFDMEFCTYRRRSL